MKKANKVLYPLLFVFVLFLVSWSFELKFHFSESIPVWIILPILVVALIMVWRFKRMTNTLLQLNQQSESNRTAITEMYNDCKLDLTFNKNLANRYKKLYKVGDDVEVSYGGKITSTVIKSIKYETALGKKLYNGKEIILTKKEEGE